MLLNVSGPPDVFQSRSVFTTSEVPSVYLILMSRQKAGRFRHGALSKSHTAPDWWLYQPFPRRTPTALSPSLRDEVMSYVTYRFLLSYLVYIGSSLWSPIRSPLIYSSYRPPTAIYALADSTFFPSEKPFLKYGAGLYSLSWESLIQHPCQFPASIIPVSKCATADSMVFWFSSQAVTFQKYLVKGSRDFPPYLTSMSSDWTIPEFQYSPSPEATAAESVPTTT